MRAVQVLRLRENVRVASGAAGPFQDGARGSAEKGVGRRKHCQGWRQRDGDERVPGVRQGGHSGGATAPYGPALRGTSFQVRHLRERVQTQARPAGPYHDRNGHEELRVRHLRYEIPEAGLPEQAPALSQNRTGRVSRLPMRTVRQEVHGEVEAGRSSAGGAQGGQILELQMRYLQ